MEKFALYRTIWCSLLECCIHWIKEPESGWRLAIAKTRGRFVAEFGGKGNVKAIVTAIYNAMQAAGYPANALNPWYFPSIGEYGTYWKNKFSVNLVTFDRPTPLDDGEQGMQTGFEMFGNSFFKQFLWMSILYRKAVASNVVPQSHLADYRRIQWLPSKTDRGRN